MIVPPVRQIRASFDESTITVYQAFSPAIADAALAAGRFVPPFKLDRMTWIKPSFLWMMHRSAWATKPGQERVLAIRMSRKGFEHALSQASLSQYDPRVHLNRTAWEEQRSSPVRVQWDPERGIDLEPLPWRTIQIGLSGGAAHDYVNDWISNIADITQQLRGNRVADKMPVPVERPYPLSQEIAQAINAST